MNNFEYNEHDRPTEPMNGFEQNASGEHVSDPEQGTSRERVNDFEAARYYPSEETRRDRIFPEALPRRRSWLCGILPLLALLLGTLLGMGLSQIPSVMSLVNKPLHAALCASSGSSAVGSLSHPHRHHRPKRPPLASGPSLGPRPQNSPPPSGSSPKGSPLAPGQSPGSQGPPGTQSSGNSPWGCQTMNGLKER